MNCPNCGKNLGDDGKFCPQCGTRMPEPAPVQPEPIYVPKHAAPEPARPGATVRPPVWDSIQQSVPASEPVRKSADVCPNCGRVETGGSTFCGGCGYRFTASKPPVRTQKKKDYAAVAKNPKVWVPILSGVALLVVVALVIGILSMAGGPLVKIGSATQKTMKAGNFTVDYEVEISGQSMEGTLYADIDTKNRTVSMYTVVDSGYVEMTLGIYDGYMFMLADYSGYVYGYTQDIEDELEEIFDAYEETGSSDMTELLEQIDELMYEYSGEELSDYFDLDELEKSLTAYGKAVSKEKWLKNNLGYSKSKESGETLHTFEPSMYDFLMASLPYFEDAFEDSDMYDYMMEELEDIGDDLDDELAMEYTIGIKSGYLSSITMVMEMDGEEMEVVVEIYDVNKTKLDESELEAMLEEAEYNS